MVAVSMEELIHLFRGDDDSMGYAHPELVVEICSNSSKDIVPTYDWCSELIYPDKLISREQSMIIRDGIKLWYSRNRPRH